MLCTMQHSQFILECQFIKQKNPLDFSGGFFCVRNQPLIAACGGTKKCRRLLVLFNNQF